MNSFRVFVVSPLGSEVAASGLTDLNEARDAMVQEIKTADRLEAFAFNLPASIRSAYKANPGEVVRFAGLRLSIQEEA